MELEHILSHWKQITTNSKISENYDLSNNSDWLKRIEKINEDYKKLQKTSDIEEIRLLLRDIFRKQLFATGFRLLGSIINEGDAEDLQQIKNLVISIKESDIFDNNWPKTLYEIIKKKFDSIQTFFGAEKLCLNILGELFGKLHPSMPIYNACSRKSLESLGYSKLDTYDEFKSSFEDFKQKYQEKVGKISDDKLPINLEIDQLFNYLDKDEEGKTISSTPNPIKYWIWATTPESWEIVKRKNIWASRRQKIVDQIHAKDKVVFYVKQTDQFKGIYEFVGEWYDSDNSPWEEESPRTDLKEIKLKPIVFGNIDFHDLIGVVEFLPPHENKRIVALPLQASGGSPSNNNKPISQKDYELIFKRLKESSSPSYRVSTEQQKIDSLKEKLLQNNQIVLYGPPGTSKTFTARKIAVSLISGTDISNKEKIKQIFEELQAKNQIELVQFHPSYSYEDFVQGIKPKPLDGGGISYEIRNGIFKKLCDRKDSTLEFSATVKTYLKITKPFDLTTLGISLNPGINNVSKEEFKKIIEKTNSDGQTTPLFDSLDSFSEYFVIKINSAEHTLDEEGKKFKINTIVPGADVLKSKLKNGPTPFFGYDEDVGGIISCGTLDDLTQSEKPRVLIIDEINRGNLSKIFGELIYALEYRDESIRLQYSDFDDDTSNDFLTIPKNLYIIGTMNTADRSISLFDTAMRRRFAFVPMMVDYDLVTKELGLGLEKYDEEQLKQLFTTSITSHQIKSILSLIALHKINKKIRNDIRMGKEKQIGHTYLLKIVHNENQYLNVWKFQILPLLEEFYSSKFEDLQNILNDKILDEEMGLRDFVATDLDELLNSIIGN